MKRNQIEKLLPVVYQRCINPGTPIYALLDTMEGLHAPAEQVLDKIDSYFNPNTAPEPFVQYLAGWVDLDRYLGEELSEEANISRTFTVSIEPGRLRALIASAARLSQWRGTAKGLKLFLETATGVNGFRLEEQVDQDKDPARVFHFRITAPQAATRFQDLITKIINGEKPAYVTYDLEFVPDK